MKNIPEELLPLIEWWEKDGKQTLVILGVAALCVGGFYGVKGWRESRRLAAADALLTSYSVEDLEGAVAKYGSTDAGAALRLRLAKQYFDNENYQLAYDTYAALEKSAPDGFGDVPAVGQAACLEALGKYEEAKDAYVAFVESKPKSLYALTARLGAARAQAASGDREGAVKALEALKAANADDAAATARIESALDLVKRWEKREAPVVPAVEAPAADVPAADAPAAK